MNESRAKKFFAPLSPSSTKATMSSVTVTVVHGNIVKQADCDGVVNSANANLRAGSGVCGAIYAAAGPALEPFSTQFAPLAVGEAVATPAFDLKCRFIIHTRGPRYEEDPEPARQLERSLMNAIHLADQNGLTRLAIPAISMGVYRYPAEEAVPILVRTALNAAKETQNLLELRFVVATEPLRQLFSDTIHREKCQGLTAANPANSLKSELRVVRITQDVLSEPVEGHHVLTYAEVGFSPLDIHSRRMAIDREQVKAFATAINDRAECGSMFPQAPISAVPRYLVREQTNPGKLVASIGDFLKANHSAIKAKVLIFDFRTPSVPSFVIAALKEAIQKHGSCGLQEVLILEM